jgi:predicted nucleic acid-binding protein
MSARYFLDTNIFVYSFDQTSAQKAESATHLIGDAISTRKGVVSYQVVQEFFNVALRQFKEPIRPDDANQYLVSIFRPLLAVHSSPSLYAEALQIFQRHRTQWYDALIVAGAMQVQCEILYSEDFQHGQRFGNLEVRNPFI